MALFVCLCLTARQHRFSYFVPFKDKEPGLLGRPSLLSLAERAEVEVAWEVVPASERIKEQIVVGEEVTALLFVKHTVRSVLMPPGEGHGQVVTLRCLPHHRTLACAVTSLCSYPYAFFAAHSSVCALHLDVVDNGVVLQLTVDDDESRPEVLTHV